MQRVSKIKTRMCVYETLLIQTSKATDESRLRHKKNASKTEKAVALHLSKSSRSNRNPSNSMFQSLHQNKDLSPNNTRPQHSAPPKSSRQLLKGSCQLLRFTLRSLHWSSEADFRDQRWCMAHWISCRCPLIPRETLMVSLPSPAKRQPCH